MKRKPPCATCGGTRALPLERCPTCTAPRSDVLPRETKKLYLTLFARTGRWSPGLFDFVNAVSVELAAEGQKARDFYLSKVKPVEDASEGSPWGLVPPLSVVPAPTFPPFALPEMAAARASSEERRYSGLRLDLSRTCGGCGNKAVDKLGQCTVCGSMKRLPEKGEDEVQERPVGPSEELPPGTGDPATDFKRLLRGFRKSPKVPAVEEPTVEEQLLDEEPF